jgi:hypothetical protein
MKAQLLREKTDKKIQQLTFNTELCKMEKYLTLRMIHAILWHTSCHPWVYREYSLRPGDYKRPSVVCYNMMINEEPDNMANEIEKILGPSKAMPGRKCLTKDLEIVSGYGLSRFRRCYAAL